MIAKLKLVHCHGALRRFTSVTKHSGDGKRSSRFTVYSNSEIAKYGRNGELERAESIFRQMQSKSVVSYTSMLTAYAQNGRIEKAREVFEEMPNRTIASYNAMISAYALNSQMIDEAFVIFREMKNKNPISHGAMISGFLRGDMFEKAEELYWETPRVWREPICSNALMSGYMKAGKLEDAIRIFNSMVEKDIVSWSIVINCYCKLGKIDEARAMFDAMVLKNVVTWCSMIKGYISVGRFVDGLGLFLMMRSEGDIDTNTNTLTTIIDGCGSYGNWRGGIQIHALVFIMGFELDVFLCNSIIKMYSKFGLMIESKRVFNYMNTKDLVSWNCLLQGYIENEQNETAEEIFHQMPKKDKISWTSLMARYLADGNVEKSVQLFNMMPDKDDVSWTALISGFVNLGQYEDSFSWFIKMLENSVQPNIATFSSILCAAAGLANLNEGLQMHGFIVKMKMEENLSVQNSLLSMYSKCGNLSEANRIFSGIVHPNIVSFNAMINGFTQNGMGDSAIELFQEMEKSGQKPNKVTFISVLSACAHMGLIAKGWKYFNMMRNLYDIHPEEDHYACMVDLLCRGGLLDEAIELIKTMPCKPHSGIWGAILRACETNLRFDLAKIAFFNLNHLDPMSSTPYVVLCNMYNISGQMEHEEKLRLVNNSSGLRKTPGSSWITIRGEISVFLAGDQNHRKSGNIKFFLQSIAKNMSWYCESDLSYFE